MTKPVRHIKMLVTYDGSPFFGFQFQPKAITVQGEIEKALKAIIKKRIRIHGSGRTDSGVHALGQVIMFDTECPIPVEKLIIGMNRALPGSIRVSRAEEVDESFHPRFSAKGKHYRYLFKRVKEASPFLLNYFFQIKEELDIELMKEATKLFLGEHDFSSYAKSPDKYHSTVRKILRAELVEKDDLLIFDVIGTGFMRNMVRNMAKVLYLVGLKELSLDELKELYCNHDRARLGPPAPASGLYLMKVMY